MKGISPLIASVLLIAFTIAVAGILSGWFTSFTKTATETVGGEATERLACSYGGIAILNLKYGTTTYNISGNIENTGDIDLGDIDIQIIYTNGSDLKHDTNYELSPREIKIFNLSAGTTNLNDIDAIRVKTNCSQVYDTATSSDIST